MNIKLIVISIVFSLLGCDEKSTEDPTQELVSTIQQNQNTWHTSEINDYTFTYSNSPTDCPTADPFPPVEISVEDGVITSIYVPQLDSFLDLENHSYPTMNMIFENMINAANVIKGTPTFDVTFGYPLSYSIDLTSSECDGESISILSFI